MTFYCIRGENLSKSYRVLGRNNQKQLYRDLSLAIRPGELVGLFGQSGCGKSTLGDILLGLKKPDRGDVFWNEINISQAGQKKRKELRHFYQKIHQEPGSSFPPQQRIEDALHDIVRLRQPDSDHDSCTNKIASTIQELHLEKELLNRYPDQLSGGEIQRFALARVLLNNPVFLVADEPTSRLDYSVQAKIIRLLMQIAAKNKMGVLLISHDHALLEVACRRIVILDQKHPEM